MAKKKTIISWVLPSIICIIFILCAAVGMLIYPEAFHKFFSVSRLFREIPPVAPHKSYYWDVEAYAEMAINPTCKAFYPLWPFLIRNIFHPQTIEQAAHCFLVSATFLFFISTFLFFWLLQIALQSFYLAFLLGLAYAINPMAIFRVIGYTESLFTFFSIFFIWICLSQLKINENLKLSFLFFITFLMSLTRPILIQIFFSTTAAMFTISIWESYSSKKNYTSNILTNLQKFQHELKLSLTIWISALLGYAAYGSFCLKNRGDFFAPFHDQSHWGKSFGLHLELLFFPKTLLIDLLGLYLPLIILCLSLTFVYLKLIQPELHIFVPKFRLWWNILFLYPPLLLFWYLFNYLRVNKNKLHNSFKALTLSNHSQNLAKSYIFWVCIYFTVAHSAIIFLTQGSLFSLGRYVFAMPFLFVAIGYLYRCIPGKTKYNNLFCLILISAIMLIQQWVRYGQDKWLG
ncbi:mannosyltransferase [Nostoc sp. T09]|uniref:mannosyltransferase n=1 Tax=Nostoc sp. T09 TaxID=1932621 RepID=UPI000A38BAF6|nr:mannosyltransferase [Nostoc sp. T09]OUL32510.1 mannosyltransferase [Nostoc sp. T09]